MSSPSNAQQQAIRFPCPMCGRRLRASASDSGKAITCPECREALRVPDFAAPPAGSSTDGGEAPAKPRRRKSRPAAGGLPPVVRDEPPSRRPKPLPPASPLDQLGLVREEAADPPPRWTFLTGVFDVPFQPQALPRWACLVFGLVLTGLVFTVVLSMAGGIAGGAGVGGGPVGLAIGFFILPLFWLGLYTFSYGAALGMAIVEETAAGNRRVANWPDPQWKEWAATFIPLAYLLVLTAAVAWGVGALVGESLPDWKWPAFGIALLLLYPFLLMCSLESGQYLMPFSGVVTGSLFPLWWAWLTYYGLAGATAMSWIGAVWLGAVRLGSPFLTSMLSAPLLGYVMLVEARLLGRLAWRIGERGVPIVDDDDDV